MRFSKKRFFMELILLISIFAILLTYLIYSDCVKNDLAYAEDSFSDLETPDNMPKIYDDTGTVTDTLKENIWKAMSEKFPDTDLTCFKLKYNSHKFSKYSITPHYENDIPGFDLYYNDILIYQPYHDNSFDDSVIEIRSDDNVKIFSDKFVQALENIDMNNLISESEAREACESSKIVGELCLWNQVSPRSIKPYYVYKYPDNYHLIFEQVVNAKTGKLSLTSYKADFNPIITTTTSQQTTNTTKKLTTSLTTMATQASTNTQNTSSTIVTTTSTTEATSNIIKNKSTTTASFSHHTLTQIYGIKIDLQASDPNNDNKVDSSDATCVLIDYANRLAETENYTYYTNEQADSNGDGKVDSMDATNILIYYANDILD